MKVINFYLSVIIISTLVSCDTYSGARSNRIGEGAGKMPNEPGKCYAKCLTPEIVESKVYSFNIYHGDDSEIKKNYVKTEVIEVAPESQKWVKRKNDNCYSADPNDCIVWCLVTEPANIITIENMLMDTTVTKEYITETRNVDYISQVRNQEKWMTVVCDPTEKQLTEIQHALSDQGYDLTVEILQRKFGKASKNALTQFQKDNALHIGGITEESMDALGLNY